MSKESDHDHYIEKLKKLQRQVKKGSLKTTFFERARMASLAYDAGSKGAEDVYWKKKGALGRMSFDMKYTAAKVSEAMGGGYLGAAAGSVAAVARLALGFTMVPGIANRAMRIASGIVGIFYERNVNAEKMANQYKNSATAKKLMDRMDSKEADKVTRGFM